MYHCNSELEFIDEVVLQKVFPSVGSASVAAAISQDADFVYLWVTVLSLTRPHAVYDKLRCHSPT